MISIASENFIKALYKFQQSESPDIKTGAIARELRITNAAATDMAQKLATKNLIIYAKYKELKLTPEGLRVALDVVRKHRLWETFLYQVFGLTMHEIHREAELLEHLTSDFLADKISAYLGHPTTDPHGEPIPDAQGVIQDDDEGIVLSRTEAGKTYEICRLYGSDSEFFDFCHINDLKIGSVLKVNKQYEKNRMTEVRVNNIKLLLNSTLTDNIFVKEHAAEE